MRSVTFQNLVKRFDKIVAVDDVSLQIEEGELFFLLGPSGCGKTTCLRLVAGFYAPDGGHVRFGENSMNRVPPHQRNTGMVFQNYALWPHLTARGNIEYGLRVRKVERAERNRRVDEALEMVRLGGLGERYPNQLSGGQQQRVALARALVIRPDVLLLDEPLSNLDAQLRLEMRSEIKRLHDETGTTALYVTHDREEALSIADRIGVMRDGKLQQVGTPRELYRAPQSKFVTEFLGETNFLSGTIQDLSQSTLCVETVFGVLQAARPAQSTLSVGQSVWCSIRPESWRVERADAAQSTLAANRLAARLESVVYLGQSEQLQARLTQAFEADAEQSAIKIAVVNPRAQAAQAGEELFVSCAPEDVVVLSE